MTPPHIEAAARAIDPQAFDDNATQLCSPQSVPRRRDQAIRIATLVWNLAVGDAMKIAEGFPAMDHGSLSTDPLKASRQTAIEIALAISALAVEG